MDHTIGGERPRGPGIPALLTGNFILILVSVTLLFSLLGGLIGASRSDDYSATASVTLATGTQQVFANPELVPDREGDMERYVESQINVLASEEVARRAATLLEGSGYTPTVEEIRNSTEVARLGNGFEIGVTYGAEEPTAAIAGANAVVEGYQELLRQRWSDDHAAAVASVNESLETAQADTEKQLAAVRPTAEDDETNLTEEMLVIIEELRVIDQAIQEGQTVEGLEALDVRRGVLATEVDAFETVFAEQLEGSEVSAAAARLDAALVREATLRDRLIQLEVNSRLGGNQVLFVTTAQTADAAAAGWLLSAIAGLVLGAFVVLGIAYWLHWDVTRIESPADARRILGYPLLWILHPHARRRVDGVSPSTPAETPPEVLAGIKSRASRHGPQVLGLVGIDDESSRTTAAFDLASSCADDGMRVLLVDGNLDPAANRNGLATSKGLADFAGGMPLDSVVEAASTARGAAFHLLGVGEAPLLDSLRVGDLRQALNTAKSSYDALIVDLPFASLQGLVDDGFSPLSCVVVVEHESRVKPVKGLMRGFETADIEPVGFVYAFNGVTDSVPEDSHPLV